MQLEVIELPRRRLAGVTHIGAYHQIGTSFGRLAAVAAPLGLYAQADPAPYQVGIYWESPDAVPVEQLRSFAGVYVSEDADIGGLEEMHQAAGRFLRAEHAGSYAALPQAWATMYGEMIPRESHTMREAPSFEVYISADHTAPPDQLRTHLYVPIE